MELIKLTEHEKWILNNEIEIREITLRNEKNLNVNIRQFIKNSIANFKANIDNGVTIFRYNELKQIYFGEVK